MNLSQNKTTTTTTTTTARTSFVSQWLTFFTRRGRVKWIVAAAVCLVFFCNIFLSGLAATARSGAPAVTYFPNRQWGQTQNKLILFWTPRFGHSQWHLPQSKVQFKECKVQSCVYTDDKNRIQEADAVLFHSRALWNNFMGIKMPEYRAPHQVWVYANMESLPHTFINFKKYAGVFNWTFTVRQDADARTLYGAFIKKGKTPWELYSKEEGEKEFKNRGHSEKAPVVNYYKQKTKFMAWTSSNCIDDARRQRDVQQLNRYFHIDKYGHCGDLPLECNTNGSQCEHSLAQYKFYLSLENSHCKDYLTEKFFSAIRRNQIPIVLGKTDYASHAPPHSYINAQDFSSYKDLAAYILKVDSDPDLYNSYFWWQELYEINNFEHHLAFCDLCEKLNNKHYPAQVYTDLEGWVKNDTCQPFSIWQMVTRVVEGQLLKYQLIS